MRVITEAETSQAAGGFSVFGVSEIETGLKIMTQVRAVAGNAGAAFGAGYALGTAIYYGYEWFMDDSLGGDIYDLLHC